MMAETGDKQATRVQLEALLAAEEPTEQKAKIAHLKEIAYCYYNLREHEKEVPYRERLVALEPTATNFNNLGVAYSGSGNLEQIRLAPEQYAHALRIMPTHSVAYQNFMIFIIRHKLFDLAAKFDAPAQKYSRAIQTVIDFAEMCVDANRPDAFAFTNKLIMTDRSPDFNKHFIVKTIFDRTSRMRNPSQLRACLLALYSHILALKMEQCVDLSNKNQDICHYTRTENLKHLVKREEDTYLRLFNAAYMNDPSEGKVFTELLEHTTKCNLRKPDSTYQRGQRSYQSYGYSNTYLGSFSASIDSLPMWVQYGNGGQGCCLIFDSTFFDEDEPFADLKLKHPIPAESDNGTAPDEPEEAERYALYKVEYISLSDADQYRHKDILRKVGFLYKEIDSLTSKLRKELKETLRGYADNILDQIRFLFKEKDYEHEQEYRVIKWSDTPLCDDGNRSGEVPHLYIELKRPLEYNEIILGPKLENPSAVAPYLHYTRKVKRITKSAIKYQ